MNLINPIKDTKEYKKSYDTVILGMKTLLVDSLNSLGNFKRNTYPAVFTNYFEKHHGTFEAIEKIYLLEDKKDDVLSSFSASITKQVQEELVQLKRKRDIEKSLIEYTFSITAYLNPAILEYNGAFSSIMVDNILLSWKEAFPKTNLKRATFNEINSGFRNNLCYITTAVCQTFGKSDDCYELQALRNYRDTYLISQTDGADIIREYYDIAPTIVNRIHKSPDCKEILKQIWTNYLKPCIAYIEKGQNEKCKDIYIKMVRTLQEEYMPYRS